MPDDSPAIERGNSLASLRLWQLLSPTIPTGAFNFSQGLEWVVEAGWVNDRVSFEHWIEELISGLLAKQELPLLINLYDACARKDYSTIEQLAELSLALRDTAETRKEEIDRAHALTQVMLSLRLPELDRLMPMLKQSQICGLAWASVCWSIDRPALQQAYSFSWLEQQIAAGIKLIPLGQLEGQGLIYDMAENLAAAITLSQSVHIDDIGYSCPAVSMASCRHETQYTRLYRS